MKVIQKSGQFEYLDPGDNYSQMNNMKEDNGKALARLCEYLAMGNQDNLSRIS